MNTSNDSVVFFGSGPVAARALELLSRHQHIEAVITKPVPSHHKGEFPVLAVAAAHNFTTHTPNSRQDLSELFKKQVFTSRVGIVIDYGFIIASDVFQSFPLGIVNSHFSLLPRWRGADPISFAILEGDTKTGVSLMIIDEQMDTGKLITQKTLHIAPDDTTPSLTKKLVLLSDELLKEYLSRYLSGEIKPHNQPHTDRATYSRKLTKEDGRIDWNKPAAQIEREIRAFSDWPRSSTKLAGKDVIITKAYVEPDEPDLAPGKVYTAGNRTLKVQTSKECLRIDYLQPAGKREMSAAEFLSGYGKLID